MDYIQDMRSGKMYPALFLQAKEKTSEQSLKRSAKLKAVTPLFLDLRRESGLIAERLWETGTLSHGESWMHNTGASPKDAEESFLWQILEANVPEKYYLSEKACQGVLRRSENRGKDLPILLHIALLQGCGMPVEMTLCSVRGDCNKVPCIIFGKWTRPHNKDEAQEWKESLIANCLNVNDIGEARTNEIIVMATQQGGAEIGHDLCPTIMAANQPVLCFALDRSSFNQGMNTPFDIGIDDSGIAHALVAKGAGAVAFGVPLGFRPENTRLYEKVSTTICNGTNPGHHQGVLILDRLNTELRRLTPTECGRHQGMPDWWCEDVPHSDTAEYKMWGNGMALPCVMYIMEGISKRYSEEQSNGIQ